MANAAYYDFFRKVVLQPDNVTLEADSTTDTLTITRGAGVAFSPNASADSFNINVDYNLYVPVGTTNIRLQDVNSGFSGVALTPGSNISIVRGSDSELIITATVGAASKSIVAATNTNPVVITTTNAHDFTEGTEVTITDVVGMVELNGNEYYMDIQTSNTFALYQDALLTIPLDGTAFGVYSTGGVATADYSTQKTLAALSDTDTTSVKPNDLLSYQFGTWQPTSFIIADMKGSVFGDDSSVLVDAVNNLLLGDVIGDVTGNVTGNVIGDLTGDASGNHDGTFTGSITLTGNIIPNTPNTYDLGDAVNTFQNLYISGDITTGNITGTNVTAQSNLYLGENLLVDTAIGGRVPKLNSNTSTSGLRKFLTDVIAGQTLLSDFPNAPFFYSLLSFNGFISYLDFNNDAVIDNNDVTKLDQVIPWVNGNQSGTNPGSFAINTYGFIEAAIRENFANYKDEYIEDGGVKYYFCDFGASFSGGATTGPAYFAKDVYLNNTTLHHPSSIVWEGTTPNTFETVLNVTDPTADNTVTIPNDSGTIQLQEKTIALNGFAPVVDFDITGDGSVFASDSSKYSQFGNGTQMSETAFLSADSLSAKWTPITGTLYTNNKAGMRLVRGNASDALKASVGDPALGHGDTFILGNIDDPGTTVKLVTGFGITGNEINIVNNSSDSGSIDIRQYAESGELNLINGPLFGGDNTSIEMTSTTITISGSTTFNNGLSGNLTGNVVGDVQGTVVGDDSTILVDGVNSFLNFINNDTDDLNEGANNLYYTDARAQSATTGRSIAMSLIFGG